MLEPQKLPEPWSWLLSEQQPLSSSFQLDGSGSPRLALDLSSKRPLVVLPTGQAQLPTASFPFILGAGKAQAFHLPNDARPHRETNYFETTVFLANAAFAVQQTNAVSRPVEKRPENGDARKLGHIADAWIDWQVWAFQELGHLPDEPDEFDAITRAATVRRTWDSARQVWFRDGSKEARMALIVRLGKEQPIHRALAAVSLHPRRILQRHRENTSISRIQELDPACIRDYARRPGITTAEKAGSRQSLLAVRRREQRDTLENRVACWVMERLSVRASAFCSENRGFPKDEKVELVNRFGKNACAWRASEWLNDVSSLRQVITQPNYPLQFEARYQIVWKTYQRLLKEKREIDDAWTWQRVLWGETARQLLGCCLHQYFTPKAVSTPFYRTESRNGCWTEAPIAPGPFQTRHGECLIFDCRDLDDASGRLRPIWIERPAFSGAEYIGASGCDQILLWPQLNRAMLVWHFYNASLSNHDGGLRGVLARCGKALETLSADFRRFAQSNVRLSGLLLVADLGRVIKKDTRTDPSAIVLEDGPRLSSGGSVNALCVPPDVEAWPKFAADFRNGLDLVFEELLQ
jgi:hypothetical protein